MDPILLCCILVWSNGSDSGPSGGLEEGQAEAPGAGKKQEENQGTESVTRESG